MSKWQRPRLILAILSTLVEEIALALFILLGLPRLGVHLPLGAIIGSLSGLATYAVISYRMGSKALLQKPLAGLTDMTGGHGIVKQALSPQGIVMVNSELWVAECTEGQIEAGEKVSVVGQKGLKLIVCRYEAPSGKP